MVSTGLPISYEWDNILTASIQPGTFKTQCSPMFAYFAKYLLEEAISPIKITMPDEWASNYFLYVLYCRGFLTIFKTNKFGVIPQQCGLNGYNVFYQPRFCTVVNPLFTKTYELSIGETCALIKLQPNYSGIMDIVGYYANLMVLAAQAVEMNLTNSKLSFLIGTAGKSSAKAMQKVVDQVMEGKTAVWYDDMYKKGDNGLTWDMFNQDIGGNFICDKLIESIRSLHNMFLTDVGVKNSNFEKQERLLKDEINANNQETKTKCQLWYDQIERGIDEAVKLFPELEGKLKIEWRWTENESDINIDRVMGMGQDDI